MRILYLDLDAVRPDHLGCYGYHRNTSPNIDRIAAESIVMEQLYCSDSPCMPSRTSLFSGRFGARTGAICHAGQQADPYIEGAERDFKSELGRTCWMNTLREAGYRTATISSFGERHSAWWWYAGFSEIHNPGDEGMESAEEITPIALEWLDRNAKDDNWFLHINYWDAHTPYRTPIEFGEPFANDPLPEWPDDAALQEHWNGVGAQSARERSGFDTDYYDDRYPRQPAIVRNRSDLRQLIDGYDTAIRFIDEQIGAIIDALEAAGVLEETAILISADHGETLGEFNIYACHQIPDAATTRIPGILRWPGISDSGIRISGLRYHFDVAATINELAGAKVPENWDGQSFATSLRSRSPSDEGRESLVLSHAQGSCARAARWDDMLYIRFDHDAYRDLPEEALFDLKKDPSETRNLATRRKKAVAKGRRIIEEWKRQTIDPARGDPMEVVIKEGGPPHIRGKLEPYLRYLRRTDRAEAAERILERHSQDLRKSEHSEIHSP